MVDLQVEADVKTKLEKIQAGNGNMDTKEK
jgi:hypothetical protein